MISWAGSFEFRACYNWPKDCDESKFPGPPVTLVDGREAFFKVF